MKTSKTKRLVSLLLAAAVLLTASVTASAAVSDVKPGSWAYKAVQYSVENKLIAVDYSAYNMNAPAPRQDVAYAMYKLTNGKDKEPTAHPLQKFIPQDMLSAPDKYKYSVQWAVKEKLIAGTRDENDRTSPDYKVWFSPTATITRQDMAALMYRFAKYEGMATEDEGKNHEPLYPYSGWLFGPEYAVDAMAWCVANKLMSGVGNYELAPRNTLTYGQLAQFMLTYGRFREAHNPSRPTQPIPDDYYPSYYNLKPLPVSDYDIEGKPMPARQDCTWLANFKTWSTAGIFHSTGYWERLTDLSGPWDNCKALTDWLPEGGYRKDGHRYNKYDICIDIVDGLPTDDEKKAFICLNQHRLNQGLDTIEWDQAAQVIAEIRSLESQQWLHHGPDHVRPDNTSPDSILYECLDIGILATKTHNGWLNENLATARIYNELSGTGDAVVSLILSKGHNETFLATDTTHGAFSDDGRILNTYPSTGAPTVYNGLQMR